MQTLQYPVLFKSLIDQIMTPSCNVDLDTAIELLSSLQENRMEATSSTIRGAKTDHEEGERQEKNLEQSITKSQSATTKSDYMDVAESSKNVDMAESSNNVDMAESSSTKAASMLPLLLQEGLTPMLEELYAADETVESVHDALLVAVHCLMQESGFGMVSSNH